MDTLLIAPPSRFTRNVVGGAVLLLHVLVLAAMSWGTPQAASRSIRPEGRAAAAEQITYLTLPVLAPATRRAAGGHPAVVAAASVASAAPDVHRVAASPPSRRAEAPASAAPLLSNTTMAALAGAPIRAVVPLAGLAAGDAGLQAPQMLPPTSAGAPPVAAPIRVAARALPGNPLPAYPEAAREDGLQGTVHLQVQLDASGRVLSVQWLHRSGVMLLDLAARDAVRHWRFEPARLDGEAVAAALTLSIRFQLEQPVSVTMAAA